VGRGWVRREGKEGWSGFVVKFPQNRKERGTQEKRRKKKKEKKKDR
jgi:hypothetical protein